MNPNATIVAPTILVRADSGESFDFDLVFIAPPGMDKAKAKAKAAEVHVAYHASLGPREAELDDFAAAMVAAGFTWPESVSGPDWDRDPGFSYLD